MDKRIVLVARYYSIEPLGILYLAGLVRQIKGWECKVVLVNEFDFEPLYQTVRDWKPDIVGFQIWTGYHLQAFRACDAVRLMGVPVVIGGPHATYFDKECAHHADWVVKGSGFGALAKILQGSMPRVIHFDKKGREDPFPPPDRDIVYRAYPEIGASPIKSMFASVGCPFTCTYCYAPAFNEMHGGFKLTMRPVEGLINEARAIQEHWPLQMVYFQDDIFGYDRKWLEEFAQRWKREIGVPFHCQIRLELTRHDVGDRRLDLFREAGCTGISLAIESGNAFLRDRVLFRHMPGHLIEEGCKKIMDRGMTLRTEQILAVPFSNTETDLATLALNSRINPTMVWTSILAPYGGTDMGTIVSNFGFYTGNNDDLSEKFFDRSILRHPAGGPRDIEPIVEKLGVPLSAPPHKQPLLLLRAVRVAGSIFDVVDEKGDKLGTIEHLDDRGNDRYCTDSVRLQRLFIPLAKMPNAEELGRKILNLGEEEWKWEGIGREITAHLSTMIPETELQRRVHVLADEMHLSSPEELPEPIAQNPHYFCVFPEGGKLAQKVVDEGVFSPSHSTAESLDELGTMSRRHLFHYGLYRIEAGREPIARS